MVELSNFNIESLSLAMILFVVVPLTIGVFLLATALAAWLWNTTLPDLFEVPPIEFWQMFRLLILANLIVGGSLITFNMATSGGG